ncbi:MAG: hypothetical protein LBI74_02835 [Synergistaceae bacterium]|jgi:hypothetical protein|nr:hypothetical protein [Synergistaceae bacterium]
MIHDIPKPEISPNFTIDDIHKIREWNYERRKDATIEERLSDINKGFENTRRAIEEIRRSKEVKAV